MPPLVELDISLRPAVSIGLCRCIIRSTPAACSLKDRGTAGACRREKKFSTPLERPAAVFVERLTGRKVSRVGAAGTLPWTNCPSRRALASIDLC